MNSVDQLLEFPVLSSHAPVAEGRAAGQAVKVLQDGTGGRHVRSEDLRVFQRGRGYLLVCGHKHCWKIDNESATQGHR